MMNRITHWVVAAGLLAPATPVLAHAALKSATPAADATLQASPDEVRLKFSEAIESVFSSIHVVDGAGHDMETAAARGAPDDDAVLHLNLPSLPAGRYTVKWSALARDGHRTRGSYTFTVQ